MKKRIVYIVGDLSYPNGMSRVLSQKVNYLAEKTACKLYVVLTENASMPHYYELSSKVEYVNFDINFEVIQTMPFLLKLWNYFWKTRRYRKMLTNYLTLVRPDITVSILRREINFINQIKDDSRKIGEMHVLRSHFRNFEKNDTNFLKELFAQYWMYRLIGQLRQLDRMIVLTEKDRKTWTELDNVMAISNPLPMMPKPRRE